jgi:hypothetical protein
MKPCGKCGGVDRYSNGCCKACARRASKGKTLDPVEKKQRALDRRQATLARPCRTCGSDDRYKDGDCKACAAKRSKIYATRIKATDPGGYAKRNKERAARNYQKNKLRNAALNLKRHYGLSLDEWRKMFDAQRGCCAMCEKHQQSLRYRLSVDHCHKTGKVRALLCPTCNNAVAMYENYGDKVRTYLEIFK